jgi:tryptophanyl-tRNA synthetase
MSEGERKKVLLSGIQPTGVFTLGNYIGAVRNWKQLQEDYECAYFIADLHSLTIRQEPADLRKHTKEAYALLLACGIDPDKSLAFIQSHVPTHAELGWILSCYTQFGELSRMTQFKDKSSQHPENVNAGLFDYPALMAADILLYQPDYVPVGADQKQHIELTRDLAIRVNHFYGKDTFVVPEGRFMKEGARIMALDDPTSKMSKSAPNVHSRISLLDDNNKIKKSIMKATTDSDGEVRFDMENKPGISNLLSIYSVLSGKPVADLEKQYEGQGYGTFKKDLVEVTVEALTPIRDRFNDIRQSQ